MLLEKSLQFAMANHAKPAPLPPSLPEPPVSPRKDAQKEKELKSMQEMISQAKLKPAQAVNAGSLPLPHVSFVLISMFRLNPRHFLHSKPMTCNHFSWLP